MHEQKTYAAFLFDLNGTMIDDMAFHINAWHRIANDLGAGISLQRTKEECYGKNGDFIERVFPGRFSDEEKERMGTEKEKGYQEAYRPHLKLIDGLEAFLRAAKSRGIKTAIGTAAIRFNVDFILDGLNIRSLIDAVVCADDVTDSKPHPETFLRCAQALHVRPGDCLVFEDAPKGIEAAQNASMDCVVITNLHSAQEFTGYTNIAGFISDYTDEQLLNLSCLKEKA